MNPAFKPPQGIHLESISLRDPWETGGILLVLKELLIIWAPTMRNLVDDHCLAEDVPDDYFWRSFRVRLKRLYRLHKTRYLSKLARDGMIDWILQIEKGWKEKHSLMLCCSQVVMECRTRVWIFFPLFAEPCVLIKNLVPHHTDKPTKKTDVLPLQQEEACAEEL